MQSAVDLVQARLAQLNEKASKQVEIATTTKEQYEELKSIYEELLQAGLVDAAKEVEEKMHQRLIENQNAIEQFNRLKTRIDEVEELLQFLKADSVVDAQK